MVWGRLLPTLNEDTDKDDDKEKTEVENNAKDKDCKQKAEAAINAKNKELKEIGGILKEIENKSENAGSPKSNESTETSQTGNRLSKPPTHDQPQSKASSCFTKPGNRRNSSFVGKTPSINPALSINRRRHSEASSTSITQFRDKLMLPNVKVLPSSRRLSGSTIAKLGVSEYGRKALRSRNTFKNLGDKIWKMIRVKNLFSLKNKKNDEEDNKLFQYQEDGTRVEPRFSSSLSPEAQLAILKGYEDINYEEISGLYPGSKLLLKRSHTPVSILTSGNGAWEKLRETKMKVDVINAFSIHNDDELDSPLRRRKPSAATIPNFADLFRPDKRPVERKRSNSLPILVPDDQRRILSYRMENAMDILDTLKNSKGQHTVSPRLKSYPNPIRPVNAYNKWTDLWKTDFKSVKSSGLVKGDAK